MHFLSSLIIMKRATFSSKILPYLLVSPSLIVILVFFIIPAFQSLRLSLFRQTPFGDRTLFVGLENFVRLFTSPLHLNSLRITFQFVFVVVFFGLSIGLIGAVVANKKIRGMGIYRIILLWPYAISPAFAGIIFGLLMHPGTGLFTFIIRYFTGIRFNWVTSGTAAFIMISAAATWKMLGYNVIIFLAGLQTIPNSVLEAGRIDGASGWKLFWHITFPLLSPITFFLFIMNTLYGFFQTFGIIDILTMGGPGNATDLLVYRLYRDAFIHSSPGIAAAQSILLFGFVAVITLLQFKYAGKKVFYQ